MSAPVKSGEWVEGLDDGGVVVVERATGQVVARLVDFSSATIAHAKLMGRSPDLADALEALLSVAVEWGSRDAKHPALDAARAALRAAGRIP